MVTLDIDTALAPDLRMLVTAKRSARISREAASVSSSNSATLTSHRRQSIAQVVLRLSLRTTCAIDCRRWDVSVAELLLDTEAASRLMRAERFAVTNMRKSGAKAVSISSVTMAELVYGARLREDNPSI